MFNHTFVSSIHCDHTEQAYQATAITVITIIAIAIIIDMNCVSIVIIAIIIIIVMTSIIIIYTWHTNKQGMHVLKKENLALHTRVEAMVRSAPVCAIPGRIKE